MAFWREKSLDEMNPGEWESLCDGCGRCCLVKLEDEDTAEVHYTSVGCKLLDGDSCRCRDYPNRSAQVEDCVRLTPQAVRSLGWLPVTCAYRRLSEGKDLMWWHHLVSGDPDTVHRAGISVRGRVDAGEEDVELFDLVDYVTDWPNRVPRKSQKPC